MESITPISFKECEDAELLSLTKTITDHAAQITVEECPATVDFSADLNNSADSFHAALGRERKQELSVKVNTSDDTRDEILALINDSIDLYSKKKKPVYSKSAALIRSIYNTAFAGININNNSEESVGINRFLQGMQNSEAEAAAETIHIDEDLLDLEDATNSYDKFSEERATIKANDNSPRISPTRRELRRDLRAFESFINHKIRKGSAVHIALAEKINGPIAELMTVIKARQTRKESSAE